MRNFKTIAILLLMLVSLSVSGFPTEEKGEKSKNYLPPVRLSQDVIQLLESQQWEKAIEKLDETYGTVNGDENLKYYIVYCYEQLGVAAFNEKRYSDAITHLEKAVEYVDDLPHLHAALGICHFTLANYDEAEEAYNQAVNLDPKHFTGHKMLGEIYYLTNRMNEAREHWEQALKIKPDDQYTKKRLEQLKKYDQMSGDMETENAVSFSVSFDGQKRPKLRDMVLKMLDEISRQMSQELGLYPKRQIPVILLTNVAFFDITGSPKWAGGVYEGQIKIPVDKYKKEPLRNVLAHEYVHAVIFDRLSYRCPWWLNEGLAQYFSGDSAGNQKKLALAAEFIKKGGKVPPLEAFPGSGLKSAETNKVALLYALSLSAVKYFIDNYGVNDLQYILELMAEGKSFGTVVKEITGYSFTELQALWKETYTSN